MVFTGFIRTKDNKRGLFLWRVRVCWIANKELGVRSTLSNLALLLKPLLLARCPIVGFFLTSSLLFVHVKNYFLPACSTL